MTKSCLGGDSNIFILIFIVVLFLIIIVFAKYKNKNKEEFGGWGSKCKQNYECGVFDCVDGRCQ